MTTSLLHWLLASVTIMATAHFVPGFKITGFGSALIASVAIGFVNIFVWPILAILTLPITFLTFGLFLLVVNGIALKIAAALTPGFEITGLMPAVWGSLGLTFIGWVIRFIVFGSRVTPG